MVTSIKATLRNNKNKFKITFNKASFKLVIFFFFFSFGNLFFLQIIGILMGFDPTPLMENLLLYYYKNKCESIITKNNFFLKQFYDKRNALPFSIFLFFVLFFRNWYLWIYLSTIYVSCIVINSLTCWDMHKHVYTFILCYPNNL